MSAKGWASLNKLILGGLGEGKGGLMSNCPTFRYRFDLLIVTADTIVDFKAQFLYQAFVSTPFRYRFFNLGLNLLCDIKGTAA